jgi:hypothetical protein
MANEVQRFDIDGVVQAIQQKKQEFTLSFNGSPPTDPLQCLLPDQPDALTVQAALEALPTIGTGNITVAKDADFGYVCTFGNDLGDQDLPELVSDVTNMSGGTVTVSTVTHGYPPIDSGAPPFATLALPVTLHRLELGMQRAMVVTPGVHHKIVVTTDGTNLILSRAEEG